MTQASYFDIHELAELLNISASSIRRRLKRTPWELPALAYLGLNFPIRWRKQEVETWLFERGLPTREMELDTVSTAIATSIEPHLAKKPSKHKALPSGCEAELAKP